MKIMLTTARIVQFRERPSDTENIYDNATNGGYQITFCAEAFFNVKTRWFKGIWTSYYLTFCYQQIPFASPNGMIIAIRKGSCYILFEMVKNMIHNDTIFVLLVYFLFSCYIHAIK